MILGGYSSWHGSNWGASGRFPFSLNQFSIPVKEHSVRCARDAISFLVGSRSGVCEIQWRRNDSARGDTSGSSVAVPSCAFSLLSRRRLGLWSSIATSSTELVGVVMLPFSRITLAPRPRCLFLVLMTLPNLFIGEIGRFALLARLDPDEFRAFGGLRKP
jgi:hypothetical protein